MRPALHWLALGILALSLLASFALAEPPTPPPYYAIQNVRVVTGTGQVLENVTVTLADGLIEAIGNPVVPADAWLIDGKGLTLYPGLIDALSTLGQKKKEEESETRGGAAGGRPQGGAPQEPPILGPEDRPQTTPWVSAADEQAEDARLEKWRKAGFTAAVSSPTTGIFAGQAALIALHGDEPAERVLRTPVAQRLNFASDGGFRAYPGSLMGVLSYIEQVLEDTRHYARSKADYEKAPAGRTRPAYDRTLEPIEAALAQELPFLMPANMAREIDRALALGKSYGLPTIVYGAQGAYASAERLAAAHAAAIVKLDWPKEAKDRDPQSEEDIRTLMHRRMAASTPAALAAAHVQFAFSSDGLSGPADIFEAVRKAIAEGLSHEDALAAFSSDAAAMFGAADRVGTIEKGKIANLVLANDWPWAEAVEVASVFVDGRRYVERKSEEPKEQPGSDVSGSWALVMKSQRGDREMTMQIDMAEDGKVSGEMSGESGETKLEDAHMGADKLRFKTTREFNGRSMTASWTLTVEGEKLSGTMSAGPMAMDISGERTAKAESESTADAKDTAEAAAVSLAELREARAKIQGPVKRMGDFAITNVTVWTLAGENIEHGTVLVKGGKIAAVGSDVAIPKGVEIIDGEGGALTPGIIDCHSHLGIEGGVNEGTLVVTAMVDIGQVVNPDDISIYRALAGGVTAANLLHGSANPIGGQNQVVKLRWGADAEAMKLAGAPLGIKFALGENPKRSNSLGSSVPARYPKTRMGVMDVIRQAFTEAREYQEEWAAYRRGDKRNGVKLAEPRRDLELETLVEILEGKRLVHSHCYRADEILQLLRLAEEFGFRVATLQHVLEGYKVADEIAAHGAGASTFSDWWGYKVEAFDAIPHNAALMHERGVVVSINSDSAEEIRHLNQEAGKCVKWGGMDEIEALKMVTLNPAQQLRIDHLVGSIEVGKAADLALFDGPPLAIRSVVQKTFVDGDLYFDLAADRERTQLIASLREKLAGKDGEKKSDMPASTQSLWGDTEVYSCREDH